jgi:hypothetical protein
LGECVPVLDCASQRRKQPSEFEVPRLSLGGRDSGRIHRSAVGKAADIRGDKQLAFFKTADDLNIALHSQAQCHWQVDGATVTHCNAECLQTLLCDYRRRHDQSVFPLVDHDGNACEHARTQQPIRVGDVDFGAKCAGRGVQAPTRSGDFPLKRAIRQGIHNDFGRIVNTNERCICLGNV